MACKLNGTKITTKTQEGKMLYIFNRCMTSTQKWVKMTPTLACAIVGNAGCESIGYRIGAYNPNDNGAHSGGLFGFRGAAGEAFDQMVDYCKKRGKNWKEDIEGQVDFFFSDAMKYNWTRFGRWYKNHANADLSTLTRGFAAEWEVGAWKQSRLDYAKKMNGLLDKYGDGCTVVTEGTNGGDGYDPCDEHQMTADELYEMFDEGDGHELALIGDSWAVGLVKSGIITKEHFNVSHVKEGKDVTWFAEQIKSASDEGILSIVLTSGLNSLGKKNDEIMKEYRQCIDNAHDIEANAVFIVEIPYTKHSNQKLFNDKRIDQLNSELLGIARAANTQYKSDAFGVFIISIPNTIKTIRDAMSKGDFHPKTNSHYRLLGKAILNDMTRIMTSDFLKRLLKINKQPRQPEPGWSLRKQNTGKDFISKNPIYQPKNLTSNTKTNSKSKKQKRSP